MMVVAPTVLVPVAPTAAPADEAVSAPATPGGTIIEAPVVTLTAATAGYEWNPNAAGTLVPARDSAGPPLDLTPEGNANIPLLTRPGLFGGAPAGSGGSSRGGGALLLYDYYHMPNNFGARPAPPTSFGPARGSSSLVPPYLPVADAPGPDAETAWETPTPSIAAVPEPTSILATLTGLGLVAASAALRRHRPR